MHTSRYDDSLSCDMSMPFLRNRKNPSTARPTSFTAIAKEVDPEDEDLILHRRERLIPWTKSPFYDKNTIEYRRLRDQRRQALHHGTSTPGPISISSDSDTYAGMLTADELKDVDKSNDEERGERPPAWLDLFFDLAWASTFSNLTQNNVLSTAEESISYAVFFSMVWWMWVTQVSYDIRFYSNDWFHRICVFLQLCIFGTLAAFTSKFDITAFVGPEQIDPKQTEWDNLRNLTDAQRSAREDAGNYYPQVAFTGIACVVGVSRFLLFLQYLRVWLYAPNKRDPGVIVKPITLIISASLWLGSFAMLLKTDHKNHAAHISKFFLWGIATALEIAGHFFTPPSEHLRSTGSLTARLSTLVTIILGEGLNAITGTLRISAQSLGFNPRSAMLVLATAVIIYLTFYLYFEGTRPRISKNRRPLWIFLHLPYMLCVILLLEGLKNLMIYTTLHNSSTHLVEHFKKLLNGFYRMTADQVESEIKYFNKMGLPFNDTLPLIKAFWDENYDNSTTEDREPIAVNAWRVLLNITIAVFDQVERGDESPARQLAIHNYMTDNTLVSSDLDSLMNDRMPNLERVLAIMSQPQVQCVKWISALAGGVLIFLAFINVAQSWPKDRYAWGSVLSRFLNGTALLFLLLMNRGSGSYDDQFQSKAAVWAWLNEYWTLPTLALSLVVQTIIDHILLVLSVRSADKLLERNYEPSLLNPPWEAKDQAYDPPMVSSDSGEVPAEEKLPLVK